MIQPSAMGSTMAERKAARDEFLKRHPPDPFAGLVCLGESERFLEDRKGNTVGSRIYREFAYKESRRVVAYQWDDGPITLLDDPGGEPSSRVGPSTLPKTRREMTAKFRSPKPSTQS